MYSPEIMQLVQKGIMKKAAFCLFSPECVGWDSARYFAWAGLLEFVSLTMQLRRIFWGRWLSRLDELWGFVSTGLIKEPHSRTGFCPCFPGTDCSNSWSCPVLGGEQELEAAQPPGCPAGGRSAGSPRACSSWKFCAWAVGSPSGEAAEHVRTSLHVVRLRPFVLLASLLSSGTPGDLAGSSSLAFQVHVQWT